MNVSENVADAAHWMRPWPEDGLERRNSCPACLSDARESLYDGLIDRAYGVAPGTWTMVRCTDCGTGYLDPRPTQASVHMAYRGYYTHTPPADPSADTGGTTMRRALRNGYLNARYGLKLAPSNAMGALLLPALAPLRRRAERWIRHLPPLNASGRLLEIGCGNGSYLLALKRAGWDVCGIEPDPGAAAAAREAGLDVMQGQLDSDTFAEGSFRAVSLHHVIEHVHDPREMARVCMKILEPGGLISIITPNLESLGSHWFGRDWYPLQPPTHLHVLTRKALVRILHDAGFESIKAHASSFVAGSMIAASASLKDGTGSNGSGYGKGIRLRVLSLTANLAVFLGARHSEELVVTAMRPMAKS